MSDDKIEGISEYCDHWCERCAFSARCEDYFQGSERWSEDLISNPKLLERVRQNFEKAMRKIEISVPRKGFDVYTELDRERTKRKLLDTTPVLASAIEYSEITKNWLKSQPGMLDRLEKLKSELVMGVESVESGRSTAESIKDALAIIHWDESLIHSKLIEALSLKIREHSDIIIPTEVKSDGLAKVVLISIDRSLAAWRLLFDILPDREDDFLMILAHLQKLLRSVELEFPGARAFKRPGFDESGSPESR